MMKRATGVWMVLALFGCDKEPPEIHADDLVLRTVTFVPDEANGGVAEWYYDFPGMTTVYGCNDSASYGAERWEIDEPARTVKVHFAAGWEEYTLTADDDALSSGNFDYDSSAGVQMTGTWTRALSPGCIVDDGSVGGAVYPASFCACEFGHQFK